MNDTKKPTNKTNSKPAPPISLAIELTGRSADQEQESMLLFNELNWYSIRYAPSYDISEWNVSDICKDRPRLRINQSIVEQLYTIITAYEEKYEVSWKTHHHPSLSSSRASNSNMFPFILVLMQLSVDALGLVFDLLRHITAAYDDHSESIDESWGYEDNPGLLHTQRCLQIFTIARYIDAHATLNNLPPLTNKGSFHLVHFLEQLPLEHLFPVLNTVQYIFV
jgi:hypothetical protein